MTELSNKPNILMFAPMCIPANRPEAIVAAKLVTAMSEQDWKVDVVTWTNAANYYPDQGNEKWYKVNGNIYPIFDLNRRRFKDTFRLLKAVLSLKHFTPGLIWADRSAELARKLIRENQYNFIISRSNPYWGHLPALVISKVAQLPWIAVWNDPVPQSKLPPPYGKGSAATIPAVLKRYLIDVCRQADCSLFPSERLMNYMCSYLSREMREKSFVVPHVCLSHLRYKNSNNAKFILLHTGLLDEKRDPESFLAGVKIFMQSSQFSSLEIHWVGTLNNQVQSRIKKYDLVGNSFYRGSVSYQDAINYQSQATVLVIIEAPCKEGIFLPSKFIDYIQSGKPILAVSPKTGVISDILKHHGGGIVADVNSAEDVAKAINILYEHWKAGTLDEEYSSDCLTKMFGEEYVLGEYMKIFKIARQKKEYKR